MARALRQSRAESRSYEGSAVAAPGMLQNPLVKDGSAALSLLGGVGTLGHPSRPAATVQN